MGRGANTGSVSHLDKKRLLLALGSARVWLATDLIRQASRGSVESYNLLVSRWEKRVYNYLLRITLRFPLN